MLLKEVLHDIDWISLRFMSLDRRDGGGMLIAGLLPSPRTPPSLAWCGIETQEHCSYQIFHFWS